MHFVSQLWLRDTSQASISIAEIFPSSAFASQQLMMMCYYRGAGRSHAYHGADVFRTAWMLKMSRCQRLGSFRSNPTTFTLCGSPSPWSYACDLLRRQLQHTARTLCYCRSSPNFPPPGDRGTREHCNEMRCVAMDRSRLPCKRFVHIVLDQAT